MVQLMNTLPSGDIARYRSLLEEGLLDKIKSKSLASITQKQPQVLTPTPLFQARRSARLPLACHPRKTNKNSQKIKIPISGKKVPTANRR